MKRYDAIESANGLIDYSEEPDGYVVMYTDHQSHCNKITEEKNKKIEKKDEKIEQLRKLLIKYGSHTFTTSDGLDRDCCECYEHSNNPCTCGFEEALKE